MQAEADVNRDIGREQLMLHAIQLFGGNDQRLFDHHCAPGTHNRETAIGVQVIWHGDRHRVNVGQHCIQRFESLDSVRPGAVA